MPFSSLSDAISDLLRLQYLKDTTEVNQKQFIPQIYSYRERSSLLQVISFNVKAQHTRGNSAAGGRVNTCNSLMTDNLYCIPPSTVLQKGIILLQTVVLNLKWSSQKRYIKYCIVCQNDFAHKVEKVINRQILFCHTFLF